MKSIYILILALVILTISCQRTSNYQQTSILYKYAIINQKEDIFPFKDRHIEPYIYTKVISLKDLPVKEKKKKFIEMLLPSILITRQDLLEKIKRIEHIQSWQAKNPVLLKNDSLFISKLFKTYKCEQLVELKHRLKPHPASIVLGQAAIESGWGTSRFFNEANNVFGIWSYHTKEKRIKALVGRDSTNIYLKSYSSIDESVKDYYKTIARVNAYKNFRSKRYNCDDPLKLVSFLNCYSELGDVYTNKLKQLIKSNKLIEYDSYAIKEEFFTKK